MNNVRMLQSYDLFGAKITPSTLDALLDHVSERIDAQSQCVVASQNLHGMHVRLWEPALNALHNLPQTVVHIDGMPLVLLCRLRGIKAERRHRLTLVDLIWPLLSMAAQRGWRVYYLGGTQRVARDGTAEILRRLPSLQLRAHHGYFADATGIGNAEVLDEIRQYRPHLVLVGMGMGVQERWILENVSALAPASVFTVGACMEYVSGMVGTPPRWMGRMGLEWLFRFTENPGRFWYRYLVEPWFVLANILWYASLPERARARLKPHLEADRLPVARELAQAASSPPS